MSSDGLSLPGTWSAFYRDASGQRAVLDIAAEQRHVLLTTASGEVLRFSPTEVAMLLENLESVADYCVRRGMSSE